MKEKSLFDKPSRQKKVYKSKEKIPATVKNILWRKFFNDNMNGICCCCKVENISIKEF